MTKITPSEPTLHSVILGAVEPYAHDILDNPEAVAEDVLTALRAARWWEPTDVLAGQVLAELVAAVEAHKRYWPRVDWESERCERAVITALARAKALLA